MSHSPSDKAVRSERTHAQCKPLEMFSLFAKLPIELRLKIWGHVLPGSQVIEIEWSRQCNAWQFTSESKPSMTLLHGVNKEARGEFLRSYTAISLEDRAFSIFPLEARPALSFCCFFNFEQDTLYIAASTDISHPYVNYSMDRLSTIVFQGLKHLAVQGETFWSREFEAGQPYIITPFTQKKAAKLASLLARFSSLETLSIVVGDDYSQALQILGPPNNKPQGIVELTDLTCGRPPTSNFVGAKEQFLAWMEFLRSHFPEVSSADLTIKQALRGGKLDVIDVWGILDHESP